MPETPKIHHRVLVLGHDIRAFLSVARSLGRAGIEVHVAMCPPDDLALRSRYVSQYHQLPAEEGDNQGWNEAVCRLATEIGFDLVIPTNDESAMLVQQYRESLSRCTRPYALNQQAFDIAFNKIESTRLAESLGLMVPRQQTIDLHTYQAGQAPRISFPLVAKPPSSLADDKLSIRREVKHIKDQASLDAFVVRHRDWEQALLQEYFFGTGAGVEVLALEGKILFAFQHIRVHEPLDGGASSYRRSMELNPILATATKQLMRAMNYSGVAMVEYKLNTSTGQWIFIEINGRFWGSLPLAIAAGANFPLFLYQQRVEGKTEFDPDYNPRVYSRNLLRDLYWMADNLAARLQKPPPKASVPMTQVFRELGHIVTGRDRIDSFAMDDLKPGLGELGIIASELVGKLKSLIKKSMQRVSWYRRQQANRIVRLFRDASQVEIVCYGNICRSAFAAPYLAQKTSNKSILSSGVHPEDKRPAPELAIEAARSFNVDLNQHRSDLLDRSRVDQAGLILVFDDKNYQALRRLYPHAMHKVAYLGYLLPEGDIEISDPYAHDLDTFKYTYRRITRALDQLYADAL
ncbi:hypothetical protein G8764_05340 [Pseudomaricurvus alcaniphilus]|uniref:arsenate reductase/protein-tyrosine-phosphatase family protein n=1 Tax=Pseudomaricurvus alcaniphilus TaxID=1166482 RepID=UPI00140B501F|nr:ATP-grasp domain-containing protein [Pseudomaricurvus alcaniphilus]NHN36713.1 hypothetical protein [Pseudomaricurvus alcaniphilus]